MNSGGLKIVLKCISLKKLFIRFRNLRFITKICFPSHVWIKCRNDDVQITRYRNIWGKFRFITRETIYEVNETNPDMIEEEIEYQRRSWRRGKYFLVVHMNMLSEMKKGTCGAINCFVTFWFLEWSLVKNVQKRILP